MIITSQSSLKWFLARLHLGMQTKFFSGYIERETEESSDLLAILDNVFIDEMSLDRRVSKIESSGTFPC